MRPTLLALALLAPLAYAGPPPEQELARLEKAVASGEVASRETALTTLARMRHPRVVKILAGRFRDEPSPALQRLVGHLLSDKQPLVYYRELRKIVRDGRRGRVKQLIDHAIDEPARYLRTLDLWASLELDPAMARRRLKTYLLDKDVNRLLRGAEMMGLVAKGEDGKALYPLLRHPKKYVRIEALLALSKLRALDCDETIARVAVDDAEEHVRRHAVWALYERGGAAGLRLQMTPFANASDKLLSVRGREGLNVARIRASAEEGPLAFRYKGKVESVLTLFRAAELERPVLVADAPADVNKRIKRAFALMDAETPKYSFFVRFMLKKITFSDAHPTGTYVATRVFNIKSKTVRAWSLDHLAKTLVHEATHAYLYVMGEKYGEHRGEAECFQEAFWIERLLTGRPEKTYRKECDLLLRRKHWAGKREY